MIATRLALAGLLLAVAVSADAVEVRPQRPPISHDTGLRLYSTQTLDALASREAAGPDTFVLYGGPGNPDQGKFQDASGLPDFQGWTSVDQTWVPITWQVSTFRADNLNGHGPGNLAYWCGQDEVQQPGWSTAPGYGNNWTQELVWESPPVADPLGWETVDLDFFFNTDLEPGYDFLEVAYHFAGNWVTVAWIDDRHDNLQYAALDTVTARPLRYEPNSYAGENHDRIQLRIRVTSDGVWSDEDGKYPSDGAAQIDDISITWSTGSAFEDFEGPGPYLFEARRRPFAGDFADALMLLTDLDACRSNPTPGMAFIDYGQDVRNGPGPDGQTSTGGATSPWVEYGITGYYIVNPAGGLADPVDGLGVHNSVISPEIPWNLPGPEDDGDEMAGAILRYDLWNDLSDLNLVGRVWDVRTRTAGANWGPWVSRGYIYFGEPEWKAVNDPIGDLLYEDGIPDFVQVRLGVLDASELFGYGVRSATPAPVFDNVTLLKHRIPGPVLYALPASLAHDAFPHAPVFDVSTQAARDQQDVAFDMAQDVNSSRSDALVVGDSIVVSVEAVIAGSSVADVRMVWALQKNPFFEDAIRSAPNRPQDQNVVAGAQLWTGEVLASPTQTSSGAVISDRYTVDLPDVDFLYPGDLLHYYFRATDDHGRVSSLPVDLSEFSDFTPYGTWSPDFTVRALPSVGADDGTQPGLLVVYDAESGGEWTHVLALRELGAAPGVHYDTYRVAAARSRLSNGIGSAEGHGARADQLAGYDDILYLSGSLPYSLSDGTNDGPGHDKSDDLGLITAWSQLPGQRRIAYFGDSIVIPLATGGYPSYLFLANQLGVHVVAGDAGPVLEGALAPYVEPAIPAVYSEFVANGGCPVFANFDWIEPVSGGYMAWQFRDSTGPTAAAIMKDRVNGFDVVFPISFGRIENGVMRILPSARAVLLSEIFDLNVYCATQPCTGAPPQREEVALSIAPNPFNPSTTVQFTAAIGAKGSVQVFNLRGELVTTLHDGEFTTQQFTWDGTDARGASVASGVYVVRATDGSTMQARKVALVK